MRWLRRRKGHISRTVVPYHTEILEKGIPEPESAAASTPELVSLQQSYCSHLLMINQIEAKNISQIGRGWRPHTSCRLESILLCRWWTTTPSPDQRRTDTDRRRMRISRWIDDGGGAPQGDCGTGCLGLGGSWWGRNALDFWPHACQLWMCFADSSLVG